MRPSAWAAWPTWRAGRSPRTATCPSPSPPRILPTGRTSPSLPWTSPPTARGYQRDRHHGQGGHPRRLRRNLHCRIFRRRGLRLSGRPPILKEAKIKRPGQGSGRGAALFYLLTNASTRCSYPHSPRCRGRNRCWCTATCHSGSTWWDTWRPPPDTGQTRSRSPAAG